MNKSKISKKLNNLPLEERESFLKGELEILKQEQRMTHIDKVFDGLTDSINEFNAAVEESKVKKDDEMSVSDYFRTLGNAERVNEELKRRLDCEKLKNEALQEELYKTKPKSLKEEIPLNAVDISRTLSLINKIDDNFGVSYRYERSNMLLASDHRVMYKDKTIYATNNMDKRIRDSNIYAFLKGILEGLKYEKLVE